MDYRKKFIVTPGARLRLAHVDPAYTGKHNSHSTAEPEIAEQVARMDRLQYKLYADATQSLLVVLQALDAGGKDGTIRHLFSGMNPQGTCVSGFKSPTRIELAHDFLWRVHARTPAKGEITIFNRSHYEDVLNARVHKLVSASIWTERFTNINEFERLLTENRTRVLKFYLHISPEEQLRRFKERLDDPARQWKISETDYSERLLWPKYIEAYEEAIAKTSTKYAPWYVIPSDHKWFRNLAISQIVANTMDEMGLVFPKPAVSLKEIRRKYHEEVRARMSIDR